MSEPHQIIEKSFSWDDFYVLLRADDALIELGQFYNENYTESRIYKNREIRFDDEVIRFYNGGYTDYTFKKEFNENILYGLSSFYLYKQVFDREETGEEEEYEGNDGCYYTRQITRKLDTYKLVKIELRIYSPQKY